MKEPSDLSQTALRSPETGACTREVPEYFEIPGITILGEKLYIKNATQIDTIAHLLDVAEVEFTELSDNDGLITTTIQPLNHAKYK